MDIGDSDSGEFEGQPKKPRELPSDLPKSLDDRRAVRDTLVRETEYYDGWQGRFSEAQRPNDDGWLTRDHMQANPSS